MTSKIKGNLIIYIEGFNVEEWRCLDHNSPNEFFSGEAGWAVGNNNRDRPCARTSHDKLRRFQDYDGAVEYIYQKQKKNPKWRFNLLYEINNETIAVSSLDDILAIDARKESEAAEAERIQQEWKDKDFPYLDMLTEKYGYRTGMNLARFLGLIKNHEEDVAIKNYSRSAIYRMQKLLTASGLNL